MKTYSRTPHTGHLLCGHWNGSPLEIGLTGGTVTAVPRGEAYHYHDYHEYYIILRVLRGFFRLGLEAALCKLR